MELTYESYKIYINTTFNDTNSILHERADYDIYVWKKPLI